MWFKIGIWVVTFLFQREKKEEKKKKAPEARKTKCYKKHHEHLTVVHQSLLSIANLEVCHPRCVCVKAGKGMQSNTTMSTEMF